jgi:hypothetical protein
MNTNTETFRILSIDAWKGCEGGWDWNNWHAVGRAPVETLSFSKRRLLSWMRSQGFLSPLSAGRVAVDDDGYNIVIVDRSNAQPLFAIEYGSAINS